MLERIYVEIGNICNLSCSFCTGTRRMKRQMTKEEFSLVCERIKPYTKYIYLHVMGEPLLHPGLDELLCVAKSFDLPVCITTNGVLLPSRGHILLDHADIVHKVSVSLHATEGNGKDVRPEDLQRTVAFAKAAAERGIYVVLRLWNMDSGEGEGQHMQNQKIEKMLRQSFAGEWQKRPRGFRLGKNIFLEYDGIFTWPTDSCAEETDEGFCHALSSQMAILADGTVVPCCLDANGEIPLGNIFENTFSEIWLCERTQVMKKGFANRKMVEPLCKKCTFARRFKK